MAVDGRREVSERTQHMTNTRTVLLAVAVLVATSLGGCVPTPEPSPTPTVTPTPSVTPSETPTPTPTLSSTEKAAADAVLRFFHVQNRVATDDAVPLDDLHTVAKGDLLDERLRHYQRSRANGRKQVGDAVAEVREVSAGSPTTVLVCLDTTGADVVDSDGKSVVPAGNPTRVLHRLTVDKVSGAVYAFTDEVVETSC